MPAPDVGDVRSLPTDILMNSFSKTKNCPSSEVLAACSRSGNFSSGTIGHLAACDFCSAEVHLYRTYPPGEEAAAPIEPMPGAIAELAEALLRPDRSFDVALLRILMAKR